MTKTYIGAKIVTAWREDTGPSAMHPLGQIGYGVKYADGYKSWSPKKVFEAAYIEVPEDEAQAALERARDAIHGPQCDKEEVNFLGRVSYPLTGQADAANGAIGTSAIERRLIREQALEAAIGTAQPGEDAASIIQRAHAFVDFIEGLAESVSREDFEKALRGAGEGA